MRIFNHVIELSSALWGPSHFKVHRHPSLGYVHIVWWKWSLLFGQPHLVEIQVHSECGGLVRNIGEDAISYCEDCEHICEGDTEYITEDEWEKRHN